MLLIMLQVHSVQETTDLCITMYHFFLFVTQVGKLLFVRIM